VKEDTGEEIKAMKPAWLQVKEIEPDTWKSVIEWVSESDIDCDLHLKLFDNYSVTFQDPTKPPATAWRRWPAYAGDTFHLRGIRSTKSNPIIFLFEPGENVKRNMRNKAKGAGLSQQWEVAEFTMTQLKRDDRVTSGQFLMNLMDLHKRWHEEMRSWDGMYDGSDAGSW